MSDFLSSGIDESPKELIDRLSGELRKYQHHYYVLSKPLVSDSEYDRLFDLLVDLERRYPEYILSDSPTQRVGSDLTQDFVEVEHSIPVLSLDKAYSANEVVSWSTRISQRQQDDFSLVVEEKIDGVSIVLYYKEGKLDRALTRGNGFIGNDVTANVKTVGAVPLRLTQPIDCVVRGEIYLPLDKFNQINQRQEVPYANPRNLASGTIRRIKSNQTASVPLQIFCYEGFFQKAFKTHKEILEYLGQLGFRTNPHVEWFSHFPKEGYRPLSTLEEWIREKTDERQALPYEIDGLVFKINELSLREKLGYTGHHPRWAIAYKFESPTGESVIRAIDIQVGRTGRLTPVARINPVEISGSVVSNVTLHNQDYIDELGISIGDKVEVSKRGDVIPAVEAVIEKGKDTTVFQMPSNCPVCNSKVEKDGAHLFCLNPDCKAKQLNRLIFFASRSQMNIDGLGEETISFLFNNNFVETIDQLYTFDYKKLISYEGFGEKKIALIEEALSESKKQPYQIVLSSLGIKELGPKVCELLIEGGITSIDKLFEIVKNKDKNALLSIYGIGEVTASSIIEFLSDQKIVKLINELRLIGLNFEQQHLVLEKQSDIFVGESWCITGSFENFKPREIAADKIKAGGGKVVTSVSGATTHLLAGEKAGSKLEKAKALGVVIVDETDFIKRLIDGNLWEVS